MPTVAASRCPTILKRIYVIKYFSPTNLFFALYLYLYPLFKNRRTPPLLKGSSSLPRFLLRKRAGYGVEPRGRETEVWGSAPNQQKIRAFCPYFALFYLFLFAREAAFGKYCLVFKAYYFYFGFNICLFHFSPPKINILLPTVRNCKLPWQVQTSCLFFLALKIHTTSRCTLFFGTNHYHNKVPQQKFCQSPWATEAL